MVATARRTLCQVSMLQTQFVGVNRIKEKRDGTLEFRGMISSKTNEHVNEKDLHQWRKVQTILLQQIGNFERQFQVNEGCL